VRVLSIARDLQRRQARERQGLFVAEGVRAVDDLLRSSLVIRGALTIATAELPRTRELVTALHDRGIPVQEVTEAEFASAADTDSPQGILAIGEIPRQEISAVTLDEGLAARIVVLDAVQDPGNVGTIVRTAAALGAAATVSLPGTVDLWNAKVVRSSMGALFHAPALACTWAEFDAFRSRNDVELWGAEAGGEPLSVVTRDRSTIPRRLAIAVGNEGSGLSAQTRQAAGKLVAVEIGPDVESLNVAVATGIMLYELRR
jgi:TrmH family RNA methyltransferase